MTILDRYLATIFTKNLVLTVVALTLFFVAQAFLGKIIENDFPPNQLLIYHLLMIPQVMVQMAPPAVIMATVFTLSGLNRTNELVACYSIGVSLYRMIAVILSLVFMVSCMLLVIQDRITPPFFRKQTTYYWREMKKRPDFFLDVKQDKIWYRSGNLIYNLKTFDRKNTIITGMSIYTFDDQFNLVQFTNAESASFTQKGWLLKKGTVTLFSMEDSFPITEPFDSKELIIAEKPSDFEEIEKEVEGLRLKDLRRYIDRIRSSGIDVKSYEVKYHYKISLSFIPLVMCLLGVPFSVRSRRQGGMALDLSLCLVVMGLYWLFYSLARSLGENGSLNPIVAVWSPSLIFSALAVFLLYKKRRQFG